MIVLRDVRNDGLDVTSLIDDLSGHSLGLRSHLLLGRKEAIVDQICVMHASFINFHLLSELLFSVLSLFLGVLLRHLVEEVHELALFVKWVAILVQTRP